MCRDSRICSETIFIIIINTLILTFKTEEQQHCKTWRHNIKLLFWACLFVFLPLLLFFLIYFLFLIVLSFCQFSCCFSFFLVVFLSAFWYLSLYVSLSVCLSVFLYFSPSVCLYFYLSIFLPFCLSVFLYFCLSVSPPFLHFIVMVIVKTPGGAPCLQFLNVQPLTQQGGK